MWRLFLPLVHDTESSVKWSTLARTRLARRREEKPSTKAGQIRALWPEIEAALAGGQSMKTIRRWLEDDAGITLGITSLTSYISRLRRRRKSNRIDVPTDAVPSQPRTTPIPSPGSVHPPFATVLQARPVLKRPDGPSDEPLAQAMQALSRRAIDIREIHNDGDPDGRKLI